MKYRVVLRAPCIGLLGYGDPPTVQCVRATTCPWLSMLCVIDCFVCFLGLSVVCLDCSMKREKADQAAERGRLHSEIVAAMTQLTSHVSYVQSRLHDGLQEITDQKERLLSSSA